MYLKQFVRDESGCASYLVGSLRDGCCAVIDPQWAIDPYLQAAAAKGLRITHVLETHLHADHISGGRRLAEATGAEICLHVDADARYPHRALRDGDRLRLGEVEVRVLHTPGHTPGGVCFHTEGHLIAGDTLFPGGPGATQFPGGDFDRIIRSIDERLFSPLDADTIVLPGHGDRTTIGTERPHLQEWVDRGW